MLRELHITNLALIEDLTVELTEGLNAFTGQTGAGKSLILGAFELLLGLRSTAGAADLVRPGADEARISGVFELHDADRAAEASTLCDQTLKPGEPLLITRKLFASGRTSVSINGQPATAAMARALGEALVDIHGQHDHQYLLKPANQLLILDAYAIATELRQTFTEQWQRLRELRHTQAELDASRTLRKQQLELYEFQAGEIDEAEPTEGEFTELHARHKVLANLSKLQQDAGKAHAALYEADGSVTERLQAIAHVLIDLADLDDDLAPIAEQVRVATLSLQEASFELSRYLDRLDHDPAEAAEVERRLDTLNRLIHKYGSGKPTDDPLGEVLAFRGQLGEQIDTLRAQDDDLAGIEDQIAGVEADLDAIGDKLTAARQAAAKKLRPKVEKQLTELGMAEAKFRVSIEPGDSRGAGPSGRDAVEMLVQTNPGQEFQPLRRIASGGETSRIMLALKSILADADRISVLVFDEIDANIGGRLGSVIGRKLRELASAPSSTSNHQVLCITHLPQIAAFADRHFRITKTVHGSGKSRHTRTDLAVLDGKARIEELAEMMAGSKITTTSRKQAQELLAAAVA
ncbi:MAG: DNA repair protein RecN [Planctomycetes bacterium]|nr:DNA repair protein RecN [Planctomycetota bacterium]